MTIVRCNDNSCKNNYKGTCQLGEITLDVHWGDISCEDFKSKRFEELERTKNEKIN